MFKQLKSQPKKLAGLVFFKDIDTANRFKSFLEKRQFKKETQVYVGLGDEEAVIKKAAKSGMITITTSALGRNTNILYDRQHGMAVYQTFVDTPRGDEQKSGRTGRQGSPGSVYYFFNQQDFEGLSVEAIKKQALQQAVSERSFNEELYNLLGYLFHVVVSLENAYFKQDCTKSDFIKNHWADFSKAIELDYIKRKNHQYK